MRPRTFDYIAALAAALVFSSSALAGQPAPQATTPAAAQGADHTEHAAGAPGSAAMALTAARASASVVVDGRLNDAAWSTAVPATDFVQNVPRFGNPASARTEARVLYDDDALYIGVRAFDSAPDSIVARLARRDQDIFSDKLGLIIDSYFDKRSGFMFEVNAAGVKVDARISDDSRMDLTWDGVWDVEIARDEQGWSAEFRVPYSQLRFNPMREGSAWGVNVRRVIARRDEISYWSPVAPNQPALVSAAGELRGLPTMSPPRRLELLPYTVGRVVRAPGETQNPYYRSSSWFGSAGGDLSFGVTPALSLSATFNPDFGQVEADPSVVNLSAFETFYPERRPFFIEGAEFFRTNGPQVFYSRRIGRAPQGFVSGARYVDMPSAATILGASKLMGRTRSGWSVGLLQAVTQEESARFMPMTGPEGLAPVEPLASYTVGRVAKDFRRGQSAVGALATAAHRSLDGTNLLFLRENAFTLSLDTRHRFGGGKYEISGLASSSYVGGDTAAIARVQRGAGHYFQRPDADHLSYDPLAESMNGAYAQVSLNKISGGNWRWGVGSQLTSPGYEINDLGFAGASDRLTTNFGVDYNNTRAGAYLRSWSIGISEFGTFTSARERIDWMNALNMSAQLNNLWGGNISLMRHLGGVTPDGLRGGPAISNSGSWMVHSQFNTDRRKPVSVTLSLFTDYEVDTDGYSNTISPTMTIRPTPRMDLSVGPSFGKNREAAQWVTTRTVAGTPRYVVATVDQKTLGVSTRLNYTFSPTLSLQLYAQPFIGSGAYSGFKEVTNPRAASFDDQFHVFMPSEMRTTVGANGARTQAVDLNADGRDDYTFGDPSFNLEQLRSTSVLRWEYRPGSALFLVWSHDRSASAPDGTFDLSRDLDRLQSAAGRNAFQVKLSYWLGL